MARFEVDGLDALTTDLADLAKLPDSVVDGMLNAEADVLVAEQRKTAEQMLRGRGYETGATARSIKKGKIKKSGNDRTLYITPTGTNARGVRNAEVAFLNEYGVKSKNIPARPFIRTANEQAGDRAVEASEKVLNAYLDSKNL